MTPSELREARKCLGLTQKGLAKALRMGTHGWQTISKWERDGGAVPGPVSVAIEYMLAGGNAPRSKDEGVTVDAQP